MKKALKIILWSAAILLAVVVALVLLLPVWSGPVVRGVANSAVPSVTGTGFNMGGFGLNPYTGKVSVTDTALQNPERFFTSSQAGAKEGENALGAVMRVAGNAVSAVGDTLASSETNAVAFSEISVNLGMLSLLGGSVHIEDILVKDLHVYGDLTFSNIREIVRNASGEETEEKKPEEEKSEGGSDVVIDHILITGMKIQWGHAAVTLPDIELKDIGKKDDGEADGESSIDKVIDAVCDAADKTATGLGTALKAALKGTQGVGKALGDAAGAAVDVGGAAVGAAADVGGAALDTAKDVGGAAVDAAKDVGGAAADAAKGAIDAVGNLFK